MGKYDDLYFEPKTPSTLLDFSKTNNYRVTSGYSAGGHNKGSKHYQGSASDPMAIDIDHRGVDYNKLLAQAQAAGYRVLDERTRPQGQAVWGGPHFHLEKIANGQALQIPQSRVNTTQPVQSATPAPIPALPYSYQNGVLVDNPAYSGSNVVQLPKQKIKTDFEQVALQNPDERKAANKAKGRYDDLYYQPEPEPQKDPTLLEGLGNVAKAGIDLAKGVPSAVGKAFETEGQSYQQGGFDAGLERVGSLLPQAVEGIRNLFQAPADLSAGIGNAYLGRNAFDPAYELPSTRGIEYARGKTLGDLYDQFPVSGFVAEAAIPVEKAAGLIGKAGKSLKFEKDLAKAADVAGDITPNGFKRNLTRADGSTLDLPEPYQVNAKDLGNIQDMLSDMPNQFRPPDQVALELQGLERQAKQATSEAEFNALQPRIKQLREEVGRARAAQEPVTGRGIDLGEPRPKVDIELPEAKKQPELILPDSPNGLKINNTLEVPESYRKILDNDQTVQFDQSGGKVTPQTTTEVLSRYAEDLDTAKQLIKDAELDLASKEQRLMNGAKTDDLAEAQQIYGKRINDIESKAAKTRLTDAERSELAYRREVFDDVINARKELNTASGLLDDTPITKRADLEIPERFSNKQLDDIQLELGKRADTSGQLEIPKRFFNEPVQVVDDVARQAVKQTDNPNVVITASGGEVFTQGGDAQRATGLAEKLDNIKADGSGQQIIDLLEAEKLIKEQTKAGLFDATEAQRRLDTLNLFVEAGRTGRKFDSTRVEIQEGLGRISQELGKDAVKTRTGLDPFAVTVIKRQSATESLNRQKALGARDIKGKKTANYDKAILDVQNEFRERAGKLGLTPTTKGKTIEANIRHIADQIRNHPQGALQFQDVYLNGHNFKTGGVKSLTDAPRGYPLRTFESANISQEASAIPTGAEFKNVIGQASREIQELAKDPRLTPEISKVLDDAAHGKISVKNRAKLKKFLQSTPEALADFCKTLGL